MDNTAVDIYGTNINQGDWLVLSGASSYMPNFRFGKVGGFTGAGMPKIATFIYFEKDEQWGQNSLILVPVKTNKNIWRIEEESLPQSLKDFIRDEYQGDPFFKTKGRKKE